MDIYYHPHHATITANMQLRIERGIRRLEKRFGGQVDATVRFEEDGPVRRVEIVLRALGRRIVAKGEARFFGPALAASLVRLDSQLRHIKRTRKAQGRRAVARA
jgi:ribosome-associated translation inhibitor RaiA